MDGAKIAKKTAADAACKKVTDGMNVGLGTGSTAEWAIKRLGRMMQSGIKLTCVPSSIATQKLAEDCGLTVIPFEEFVKAPFALDVCIDGADRIDPYFRLTKGGGGAHTREKLVAKNAELFCCVGDPSKLCDSLIGAFPLPVEVQMDALEDTILALSEYGEPSQRIKGEAALITDNSNYIVDLKLSEGDPSALEDEINSIPGVVDNGFFTKRRPELVFIGKSDGSCDILDSPEK